MICCECGNYMKVGLVIEDSREGNCRYFSQPKPITDVKLIDCYKCEACGHSEIIDFKILSSPVTVTDVYKCVFEDYLYKNVQNKNLKQDLMKLVLKEMKGRINPKSLENALEMIRTCFGCNELDCDFRFDPYNKNGECLASK